MRWWLVPLLLLPLLSAWGQAVDPRLAEPMLQAMQAQLALQQAMMKVQAEDVEAQRAKLCAAIADDKRDGISECAAKRAEK